MVTKTQSLFPSLMPAHKWLIMGLLWLFSASALAATLTSTVDRSTLGQDETLNLTVRYNGQAFGEPDFSALEQDFQVLGRNQQSQLSFNNGKRESYTLWILQLMPKKTGTLLIPSFNFKKAVSDAIEVTVTNQPPAIQSDQLVYLETLLDKDSAYVQEQLILTQRLYSRVNLNSLASEDMTIADATLIKLSEDQYQKTIKGVPHLVVESRFAVFPQSSGTLNIPSVRYSVSVPDNRDPFASSFLARSGKKVYLRTQQKQITIKPRPASIPLAEWLPSKGVSLSEKWSRPLNEWRVGEPITRTLTMTAQGLTAVQLPPLTVPTGEGFRSYPDQPQLDDQTNNTGVIGSRTESLAIVPDRPGTIELPTLTVSWWDTEQNQQRTTTLAAQTIEVLPAVGSPAVDSSPSAGTLPAAGASSSATTAGLPQTETSRQPNWLLALLGITNALLAAVVIWLSVKVHRLSSSQTAELTTSQIAHQEKTLFKALSASATSLDTADTTLFRRNLIRWAQVFWDDTHLTTYSDIAAKAGSETLSEQLQQLDQSTYGAQASPPDADILKQILVHLNEARSQQIRHAGTTGNNLKPLYETSV